MQTKEEDIFLNNLSSILDKSYFDLNSEIFADIEKLLYPIKITDSLLPNYLVPIKPNWAKELFDEKLASQSLFTSKRDLALKQEQVFYRKKKNSGGIRKHARILWYVSEGNYSDVQSIRACSLVEDVLVDKPKNLYKKYRRLGIYEWKHIYDTCDGDINNEIMVIRFSHTQLFQRPVGLERIRHIFHRFNRGLQLQSPLFITNEIFFEIYKEGMAIIK